MGRDGSAALKVLVVTGGHPFEMEPFLEVFASMEGIEWEHVQPPEAREWFRGEHAGRFDAIVCYDMQGIEFRRPEPPRFETPPPEYAAGLVDMLEAGQGIVFLHHALSAWPAWPLWPRIVGGRWHYMPGELEGVRYPASGYTREVEHRIMPLDPDHPIWEGLGEGFSIVDEVYLNPVLTHLVTPLLVTDHEMDASRFFSGQLAVTGRLYSAEGWTHPPGTGLVGWVKAAGRSPVAYLQPGHGPAAYANAGFRRLVSNAISWAASPGAHAWAVEHRLPLGQP
ncbi:MAG TPA: ThuA domain-containing protein [Acidimicrobiales bacterium]|nr:ThuA domain-containing protein [Acidimicrobiales bacterium]